MYPDTIAKASQILPKSGAETSSANKYIRTLINLGILKKETSFLEAEGRKSIYVISDAFFGFWYRFVPRNMGAMITGRMERTYEKSVKEYLHRYMGSTVEDICKQYLIGYADDLPINLNKVGRWWGTDPKEKKQIEIDLLGEPVIENYYQAREYIAGSCKFRSLPATMRDFEELRQYSRVFSPDAKFYYYIFSISGFKEDLLEMEKRGYVKLISIDD